MPDAGPLPLAPGPQGDGPAQAGFDDAAWDVVSPQRPLRYWKLIVDGPELLFRLREKDARKNGAA